MNHEMYEQVKYPCYCRERNIDITCNLQYSRASFCVLTGNISMAFNKTHSKEMKSNFLLDILVFINGLLSFMISRH